MTDGRVVLVGGSIETEDDDPGLGDCRVGGHCGRVQVGILGDEAAQDS